MTSMFPSTTTSTGTSTQYFEDGQRVFPCRCGETHRGEYALHDFMHHECMHNLPLVQFQDDMPNLTMCRECGRVFQIEEAGECAT